MYDETFYSILLPYWDDKWRAPFRVHAVIMACGGHLKIGPIFPSMWIVVMKPTDHHKHLSWGIYFDKHYRLPRIELTQHKGKKATNQSQRARTYRSYAGSTVTSAQDVANECTTYDTLHTVYHMTCRLGYIALNYTYNAPRPPAVRISLGLRLGRCFVPAGGIDTSSRA